MKLKTKKLSTKQHGPCHLHGAFRYSGSVTGSVFEKRFRKQLFFRNLLLLAPKFYQKYQDYGFRLLEEVINRSYETEYAKLPKLFSSVQLPLNVIDVGSNRGQSSRVFWRLFQPKSIHMFEPIPQMAKQCEEIFSENKCVRVHNIALGSHESTIQIFLPSYNSVTFWGLASNSASSAMKTFSRETTWNFDSDKLKVDTIIVPMLPLDAFNLEVDFLKIDVEGFELDVLLGCHETIRQHRPVALVEISKNSDEIMGFFSKLNYINLELNSGHWKKSQQSQLNQVFVPKNLYEGLASRNLL